MKLTKLFAAILAVIMVLTLAACGGNDDPAETTKAPETKPTTTAPETDPKTGDGTTEESTTEAATTEPQIPLEGADLIEGGLIPSNKANFNVPDCSTYNAVNNSIGWQDWANEEKGDTENPLITVRDGCMVLNDGTAHGGAAWIVPFYEGCTYRIYCCGWGQFNFGIKNNSGFAEYMNINATEDAPFEDYIEVTIPELGQNEWYCYLTFQKTSVSGDCYIDWIQVTLVE